jgi:Leucine-rich repeat (LRR) protein
MKIFDINVDEHKISNDKISINIKNVENDSISEMKCFRNLETIIFLEAKKINLIKISKTFFFNLPNLHHVDLRDNKLLKISENFQELKNLRSLKIDDNQISIIPNFLGNLDKLEIFTFSNNRIKNLPTSLQYLQKLKVLKFANNQISVIPIEFGLLKSLECLYMDANHFTEIPTTICYLKHLSELCFEWLEFLDPPFGKIIKDSMGRTIISIIRNSLQDMIKQNILYCDFLNFIQKNSNTCNVSSTSQLNCDNKNESKLLQKGQETNDKNVVSKDIVSNSTSLNIQGNQKKFMKIFYAIENNYYGVIKVSIQDFL